MHTFQPLDPVFLEIGGFSWQKYSVMIMLGLLTAIILGLIEGKKLGIIADDILDGVLIIVPLSILGTRLWYVIFEFQNRYLADFQDGFFKGLYSVINITDGGLAIHGGFITAFVSAYFFTKKKGINLFSAFDIMAPGFLIAQAFGRWGNFFNQEAHGGVIGGVDSLGDSILTLDEQRAFLSDTLHLPDVITNQMYLNGPDGLEYYHPTFLYESIWNVTGFIIMLILRRTKLIRRGDLLPFYLIWYSVGRFFIEGMRTDSLYIGNTSIRTAQVISVIMIAGGIVLLYATRKIWPQKYYHEVLTEVAEQNAEQMSNEGV
jgi:phosphatidylglycerol:prolipoprotein diacylglycerol transferase